MAALRQLSTTARTAGSLVSLWIASAVTAAVRSAHSAATLAAACQAAASCRTGLSPAPLTIASSHSVAILTSAYPVPLTRLPASAGRHSFNTCKLVFMSESVPVGVPAGWSAAWPFVVLGGACIVAGGLIAAAVATAPSQLGSWTAAYLVLVGGVAQVALGTGQALFGSRSPARRVVVAELAGWNAGNGAVLAGTLLGATWLAGVGGVLLVAALALMLAGIRGAARHPAWPRHLYRALIALLLVSIPVGLAIAVVRPR